MSATATFRGASRRARLVEDLNALIESKELVLSSLQKQYLRSRWVEQVLQADSEFRRAARMHHALRLLTIMGSVALVMLASLGLDAANWPASAPATRYFIVAFSLLVMACVALEHLYHYGERWRRAERQSERLQSEGWRFLQLSGAYEGHRAHAECFRAFAGQVEALSQSGVEVYNFDLVRARGEAEPAPEVEAPKKYEASTRETGQLVAAATAMPRMVTHQREPQHRAQ